MAPKRPKQKKRTQQRPGPPPPAVPAAGPTAGSATAVARPGPRIAAPAGGGGGVPQATGGGDAVLRAVERSLNMPARGRVSMWADASIPLDRVPYFRNDLRMIAIVVGTLVVLLILSGTLLLDRIVSLFGA